MKAKSKMLPPSNNFSSRTTMALLFCFLVFRKATSFALLIGGKLPGCRHGLEQQLYASVSSTIGTPICEYHEMKIKTSQEGPPRQAISCEDLTPNILALLEGSGMKQGAVNVISRHTTTAITINERELRLAKDMEKYFLSLAPPDERSESESAKKGVRYFHNDIDQRPDGEEEAQRCRDNGWDIDNPEALQAWRDQEPINAHSHLLSMLIGSSEHIPVVDGKMVIGQWQSILLVDLDGPRDRTVGVQFLGYK
jgi:thiamine phosphate synthase YjbQ (UPF0047 family)